MDGWWDRGDEQKSNDLTCNKAITLISINYSNLDIGVAWPLKIASYSGILVFS